MPQTTTVSPKVLNPRSRTKKPYTDDPTILNDPLHPLNRDLTLKQKKFVKRYIETGSKAQASRDAGYSARNSVALSAQGIETLKKPNVQKAIMQVLNKSGLTMSSLSDKLNEAINYGLGEKATNADALRGIELAFKLHDAMPSTKIESKYQAINIDLKGKSVKELRDQYNQLIAEATEVKDNIDL